MCVVFIHVNSCSDDSPGNFTQPLELNNFRESFLSKDFLKQKEEFLQLSNFNKSKLWIEKLKQVKGNNLPKEYGELIDKLIFLLETNLYDKLPENQDFVVLSQRFFEITPFTDLNNIFSNLDDYVFRGKFDEKSGFVEFETFENQQQNKSEASFLMFMLPDCNCSWTCASDCNPYCTTKNCSVTNVGCGFLWLQSCKKKAIL